MSIQQSTTLPRRTRGPGRNNKPIPDFRLTVRFRYRRDDDLIRTLKHASDKSKLLRTALRHWLQEQENVTE